MKKLQLQQEQEQLIDVLLPVLNMKQLKVLYKIIELENKITLININK